jgi:hypothetical protein
MHDATMNPVTGKSANRDHKKFIQKVMSGPKYHEGALTAEAKAHGFKSALAFAHHVLSHPKDHTMVTRHRAQFLANIQKH